MRMFAPTFLFGLACRLLPRYSWCPDEIAQLAANCPSFLTGDFGLCVLGLFGALEIAANWDDTARDLISESNVETYLKPLFVALVSYSICTPEQVQVLSAVVDGPTVVVPAACDSAAVGLMTNAVASVASAVTAAIAGMDVGVVTNAVGTAAQESVETVPAASDSSFWSVLSSLFCCGVTFCLCKIRAGIVAGVRELDPDNSLRLGSLLTLFEEGSWLAILSVLLVFPLVALLLMVTLAVLGFLLSRPLRALARKRRTYWESKGREDMLKEIRLRAIAIFGAGVFLSVVPFFGYLVTVIALNIFVFSVLSLYERSSSRLFVKLAMRFLKLTIALLALVFSGIPFLGIVFLVPYAISYVMRVNRIKRG